MCLLLIQVLSSRLGRKPEDIVKLDANENPYGPPPEASVTHDCKLSFGIKDITDFITSSLSFKTQFFKLALLHFSHFDY